MIVLTYTIETGMQDPDVVAPRVAAIALNRGELDLIGASVVGDTTSVSADAVTRSIALAFTAAGEALFPTNAQKIAVTRGLWRGVLNLRVPGQVAESVEAVSVPGPTEGLVAWLRADVGVTVFGGAVSTWDPVGTAADFTQAVAGNRPASSEADANWNNRASVSFDTDWLDSGNPASFWNFLHNGSGMTVIAVFRATNNLLQQILLSTSQTGVANAGIALSYTGGTVTFEVKNGALAIINATSAAGSAPVNSRVYVVARYEEGRAGFEWSLSVNGSQTTGDSLAAPSAGDAQAPLRIGASVVTGGEPLLAATVPETLLYGRFLTDTEVANAVSYLTRYSSFP